MPRALKVWNQLTESVFKRIFSKKYLGNTKTFEQEMQSHVISTAKKFCPDVEKEMDDTTVLQQLWIEEYAQELSLKGKLHFCLKEENGSTQEINTECYRFGTTLNSQTLEHAEIKEVQNIQKIVIFENKANYISAPYKDGILYLFSHGYFSPKECSFLKQLHQVLKNQTSCEVQYFHSGDLDYGGIKIFQYIRKTIFPELEPLQMDVETYEAYQEFTEVIDPETLEKLKRVQDENPKLQELIKRLIETGKGIEQECFFNREKRESHMKLMIASDIHGSAYYCRKMLEAYDREKADKLLLLGDILYHGPAMIFRKSMRRKKSLPC